MNKQRLPFRKKLLKKMPVVFAIAAAMILSFSTLALAYDLDEWNSWNKEMIEYWEFDVDHPFHSLGDHGLLWDGYYYGSNECVLYGVDISIAVADSGTLPVPSTISTPNGTRTVVGIVSADAAISSGDYEAHPFAIDDDSLDSISTIQLPSTVRYLGYMAFAGNKTLKSVKFGGPVMICDKAFGNCTSLSDAWAPNGSKLASNSFINCTSLQKMNCAPELMDLTGYFNGMQANPEDFSITEVVFAPEVKCAGGLRGMESLKKVVFPSGLTEIDSSAFEDCINLGTISIPDSVKNINDSAFSGCTNMNGFSRLPSSIESLGSFAFWGCKNLKVDMVQPAKLRNLTTAFQESGITGFTWNCNDINHVDLDAFAGCRNLKYININGGGFYSTDGILYFAAKLSSGKIHHHELVIYPAGKNRGGSFSVPDNIEAIYEYAFDSCSLSTIKLPRNWVRFYEGKDYYYDEETNEERVDVYRPFDNMDSKATIYFLADYYNGKREPYGDEGFAIIGGQKVKHNWIPYSGKKKGTIVKDKGVKYKVTAAPGAKVGRVIATGPVKKTIKSISIPEYIYIDQYPYKVTKISANAFKNCKKLKTVFIGDEYKPYDSLPEIGSSAFYNCPKLTKVTLGSGVKTIGSKAFMKDKLLKTITIYSAKLTKVGKSTFKGIHKNAKIKVPAKKLKAYKKLLKGKGQKKTVKIVKNS